MSHVTGAALSGVKGFGSGASPYLTDGIPLTWLGRAPIAELLKSYSPKT